MKRTALVTGASRGIGSSIAERLARDGFHVLLNYSSNEAKAREVMERIISNGGSADLCQFDVADPAQVDAKFEWIAKEVAPAKGPLLVLVNNAGITRDGLLLRMKNEDLDAVINIDLKGAIYCTRAASCRSEDRLLHSR